MFGIVRLLVGCALLAGAIAVIKKAKVGHKRILYICSVVMSLALSIALAFLPFENLFITFKSPQGAYEYFSFGKTDAELVVEGDTCDLVVDRKNASDTYLILPKTTEGWKIGLGIHTRKIAGKLVDGISVNVYQYKDTDAYFITLLDVNGGKSTISDDYATSFYTLERTDEVLGKTYVTYYGFLPEFDSQYCVTVNGKEILFDE